MSQFSRIYGAPDVGAESPAEYANFVSLGVVAHDPADPSLAFVRVESGQRLVEVELADGDAVNAWLCHQQSGAGAGDYIPVEPGESVVLVWPDSNHTSCYIIARLADVERALAGSCCGIDTTGEVAVRHFRWMRTPDGQIYAVQAGGELLLEGGGAGVRIAGAQVVVDGEVHLGADFATPPVPGQPLDGQSVSPSTPAGPFVPPTAPSLAQAGAPAQRVNGILRFADVIEANTSTDPEAFAYLAAAHTIIAAAAAFLGLPFLFDPLTKLAGRANTASVHTANDPPA